MAEDYAWLIRTAEYVGARHGVEHHERCGCRSCVAVVRAGNGWCPLCGTVMDGHKLVGEEKPVCPAGSGMR